MFIKKILFFLMLVLSFNLVHAVEIQDDSDAILKLGMEMSNMRNMLEAYILIGIKLDYKNPTQKLKNGITHYEDLLTSLQSTYKNDADIQKSLASSFKAWKIVRKAMVLALNNTTSLEKMKEGAIFIHGNIRTVIKEMARMKKILLNKSNIKDKEALDASIEIAASARRLSAHYMMELWKLDDPTIKKHWNKGLKIYGDSLALLRQSPYMNNSKFRTLFSSCSKYHRYFTKMGEKPKIFSILIDKKSNIAFKKAKEMTTIILENSNQ
jgi:hypothetical protein